MIGSAKAFVFLAILAVSGLAVGTSAHAQSATSCPGGSDPNASDCLRILDPTGAQISLLAITEQDELADPNHIWSISGVVQTDPALTGAVFALTEPGASAISDLIGVPSPNTIAFMSDAENGATAFPPGPFLGTLVETAGPLDVSRLLDPTLQAQGFKVFFQSDVEGTVPEPSTWAMLLLGFAGLGFVAYRKARPTMALAA